MKLIKTTWKNEVKNWVICKDDYDVNFEDNYNSNMNNQIHFNNNNNNRKSRKNDDNIVCPEFWMISLGSLNCELVWKGFDPEKDLSVGKYYKKIDKLNVIGKLLAIAGIRMAAILNTLFM